MTSVLQQVCQRPASHAYQPELRRCWIDRRLSVARVQPYEIIRPVDARLQAMLDAVHNEVLSRLNALHNEVLSVLARS